MTPDALSAASPLQAMIERIARLRPASTAEALRELRNSFPDSSLSSRVMAVAALQRTIGAGAR
jgi:hypothetical protein